uniref:Uncharacterized protein n=1 Tax=Rhizophagus irregularis (strain DAOM 181602 / DAOM 197198 / MUCL 43194) TaxID=747089 RepID=U9T9T1_RHIID
MTDEHQPSKKIAATGTERGPSGLYINTKVREFITCNECSKVRCLFSGRQLIEQDGLEIQHAIENWPYTCGSTVFSQDHNLFDKSILIGATIVDQQMIYRTSRIH